MRLVWRNEIPEQGELRKQWNALVLQTESPEVFFTWEWALAVARAYGDALRPWIAMAHEGEEIVGLVALAQSSNGEAVFLAGTTADYCDFISRLEFRQEFVERVLRDLKQDGVRRVVLANLPADSATIAALNRDRSFHIYIRPAYECAQVQLGSGEERQALKASLLGKKKLRQYLRGMEREGPVELRHLTTGNEITGALPDFVQAHVARFRATGRASNLAKPERQRFLAELATLLSASGAVALSRMTVGGRPAAWNFGFCFSGSWFWYQPTFDTRDEANSPGYCLLAKIIIDACDRPEMRVVDLGLGAEGYKERFGNSIRQTLHATLSESYTRHLRAISRHLAATAVKRSPRIEAAVRRVRDRLRRGENPETDLAP